MNLAEFLGLGQHRGMRSFSSPLPAPQLAWLVLALALLATDLEARQLPVRTHYVCNSEVIFEGPQQNDHMGAAIAKGQLTGNASPELIAGTFNRWDPDIPSTSATAQKYGYAFLLDGARLGWDSMTPSWPSIAIQGRSLDDRFGFDVEFIGDINGHALATSPTGGGYIEGFHDAEGLSLEDFVVSNPRGQFDGIDWDNRGEVFVFLTTRFAPNFPASPVQAETAYSAVSTASLIIVGDEDNDRFGYAVCAIGDWNDDGYDDFAVGAPGGPKNEGFDGIDPATDVRGRVHLVSGAKVSSLARAHYDNPTVNPKAVDVQQVSMLTIHGDSVGTQVLDRFGFSIVDLGMLQSGTEGFPTICIGAPGVYPDNTNVGFRGYSSEGYVEVVSRSSVQSIQGQPPTANFPLVERYVVEQGMLQPPLSVDPPFMPTEWNGVQFGFSLGATDVDGIGGLELVVGAPRWDFEESENVWVKDAGAAFVVDVIPATSMSTPAHLGDAAAPQIRWSYGSKEAEEHGFSVGSTGLRWDDGQLLPTYGVSSFRGDPTTNTSACSQNITQHPSVDPGELVEGGGRLGGVLHIYSSATGRLMEQVLGEDSRDSVGWSFVSVGNQSGDLQSDLVLTSPRWGLQELPDPSTESVGMEWGRVYYFMTRPI